MLQLDSWWDEERRAYMFRGTPSVRVNIAMLLTHAIAAQTGHDGPTRRDARARILVDRLTAPPVWLGATGTGRLSTCWSRDLDRVNAQHPSLEPKVAEALARAWRARAQLDLSTTAVARIESLVTTCARSAAWRRVRVANQINWNAELYASASVVSQTGDLLRHAYRSQLAAFAADRTNWGGGFQFHYHPESSRSAGINLDTPEYANIVVHALGHYDEALRRGMRPLPSPSMRRLRAWVRRLLAGSWTHAGYLNWDTGKGRRRWHSAQYWAFARSSGSVGSTFARLPCGSSPWRRPAGYHGAAEVVTADGGTRAWPQTRDKATTRPGGPIMPARVAINGFGRTGRAAFRAAYQQDADIQWVGINDVMGVDAVAQLLANDSVYGRLLATVEAVDGAIRVGGREIPVLAEPDPAVLPWREVGAEVIIESSGRFRARADAARHLDAGARKVIVSAPAKEPDVTVALGVNFDDVYDPERHHIISNASCTTNCLAPVAKVLHEAFGIRHGVMTTVHAYTGDQRLLDAPHKDPRRARAAALNLVPTTTGAAKAIGLVVPELAGRMQGFAVRVPTPTVSLVDLTVEVEHATSVEAVNAAIRDRADRGRLAGILAYSEDALVSTDLVGSPYSSIFDAGLTTVVDATQVKVVAWYDKEWGYSSRLVELAQRVLVPVATALP